MSQPDQPITFLVTLDRLNDEHALFAWRGQDLTRDQFERGQTAQRVSVQIPRSEWEKAGHPTTVTAILDDLTTARIDQPTALAQAWADGYTSGHGDAAASRSAKERGEVAGTSVNPYDVATSRRARA